MGDRPRQRALQLVGIFDAERLHAVGGGNGGMIGAVEVDGEVALAEAGLLI